MVYILLDLTTGVLTMKRKEQILYQSEKEWLGTGKFTVATTTILGNQIRYAITNSTDTNTLVTMVGGIPRDPDRRKKLPLINKLYGLMAVKQVSHGVNSVLYNQPATGGSSGEWNSETISTRSETLVELIKQTGSLTKCSKHAIVGASAGAYMAVKATDLLTGDNNKIEKLILISPAAYPHEIEDVPYGKEFTRIISKPWDIANSPIFKRLEQFVCDGGSLIISFFEADDPPIPRYIQHHYCEFARKLIAQNKNVQLITIPNVAHNFRRINTPEKGNVVDNDSIRMTAEKFLKFIL